MSVTISLFDLANLSISHPEPGTVNFMALHALLHGIIRHLGIQDVQAQEPAQLLRPADSPAAAAAAAAACSRGPYRHLEQKLRDVEQQVQELSRLPSGLELLHRSRADGSSVHDMWNLLQLRKKTETNREGVDKVMSLMEEMVQEMNNLKNFKNTVEDRMSDIDKHIDMVTSHVNFINELLDKTPEQLQQFVSWKILQTTLVDSDADSSDDFKMSATMSGSTVQAPDFQVETSDNTSNPQEDGSETPPRKDESVAAAVKVSDHAHATQKYKPLAKPEVEPMEVNSSVVTEDEAHLHPEAVLALQRIRLATENQPALVQRVAALEKTLSDLVSDHGMMKGVDSQHGVKTPGDADGLKLGEDMRAQVSSLRDMVKKIDEELKEMRKFQEISSEGEGQMQQQLDKLGPVLEKIMSSSCALLGMSLGLETEATCPVCSLDVSQDASNLCQRFQKLQDTVNTLVDSTGDSAKDLELQNHILQLQGECERLNAATSQLLQDDQLHQKNIEALFESMNHLERKCYEGNISRTQFDAVTDQINKMVQGLLNKICTQEKDWGCILEQLTAEMDCKLDRIELNPLKKQLEDRWQSIRQQLLKHKDSEHEGAAGLKKQLISHFHCLSCDRPLDIKVPTGLNVLSLPIPTHPTQGYHSQRNDDHSRRRSKGERMSELRENFPVNARSCGGSHTLTYGYHRRGLKGYDHHPTTMLGENDAKQWTDSVVASTNTQVPKPRINCKLPSIGGKDVTKYKPTRCLSRKSSSSKLSSCQSYCAYLPPLTQPGSVMPEQSLSSEADCQSLADPSLLCPCPESQMSGQPSLSCPLMEPVETLDLPRHSGVEQPAPVKPVNI
ncbi:uncharacterized protein LOC121293973 [Carcharodon carcharias]|uniref:uncharacterized protein LOC121293973 n=1 Tax=Carcharodon carcharias TaxID=13397 RepID=UPI001B7E93A6|nr:uncharacterized protein LOC121293973 [Carcharodon carcharias]